MPANGRWDLIRCLKVKGRKAHAQLICAETARDLQSVNELTDKYKSSGGFIYICNLHAEL